MILYSVSISVSVIPFPDSGFHVLVLPPLVAVPMEWVGAGGGGGACEACAAE